MSIWKKEWKFGLNMKKRLMLKSEHLREEIPQHVTRDT